MNGAEVILSGLGLTRERVAAFFGRVAGPAPDCRPVDLLRRPVAPDTRRRIRALHVKGKSQAEIAAACGVPAGTVWHITKGKD
jgi:DNA invertase Pin-like site-specific DNA recombinase